MKWMSRTESSGNSLTDAHQLTFPAVSDLYHGQDPHLLETYRNRAKVLDSQYSRATREQVVDALQEYMLSLGAGEASLRQLERLRDPRSVAVITGQQAGLFTGPLYAVYKALSAIGWAQRLEQELDRPVVPVFWVASEDHDWGEVNHAFVLDKADQVRKIRLPLEPPVHEMVYHTRLTKDAVRQVLAEADEHVPDGPFKREVLAVAERAYQAGSTLANGFVQLLWHMVEPHGLVMVDPCLPSLRRLVGQVWTHTLDHLDELQAALDERYRSVSERGYTPLVLRDPDNTTVFYVEDGQRYVLERKAGDVLNARGLGREMPVADWKALAESHPEQFSSNVLLRPVVQDYLLPTLLYVGGQAEVSYHALAGATFAVHQRTLPPLMLRHRLRVFTPTVQRHMDKWGLGPDDLDHPLNVSDWLRHKLEGQVLEEAFAVLQRQTVERWQEWGERFASLGPQVQDMANRQTKRELASVERLMRKSKRLYDLNHAEELRQLNHLNRWIWTDGVLQERRLSPLNVWMKYGIQWLADLPVWTESSAQLASFDVYL